MNAEFQRVARRDKKAFLQRRRVEEIEENSRMETLKISSRKLETPREHYAKMNTVKDRNGMDLTEAEDTFKRRQEYKEELYKNDLHDTDNCDDLITNLEPNILVCEVKWALGSITTNKASADDGILVELFQILKDDTVKVLYSILLWGA